MSQVYREQRRRKLLRDDTRSSNDVAKRPVRSQTVEKRIYSDAALRQHQPRVTDLIPRRKYQFLVVWLLLLIAPAALVGAYFGCLRWANVTGPLSPGSSVDLLSSGSLAGWWNSLTMLLAAALGVMIFHLRRHKLDDYRARYRIWPVVTGCFLLASAACVSEWHVAAADWAMALAREWEVARLLQPWWPWILVSAAVLIWLRLWIEMWPSRGASVTWFLSAAGFVAAGMLLQGWCVVEPPQWQAPAKFAAWQIGIHQLLFSLLLYLGFVYQTAQQHSAKSARKSRSHASGDATAPRQRTSARHTEDSDARPSPSSPSPDSETVSSKSERRRERKEMRRQQRAA